MRHFMQLNDFGLTLAGESPRSYHPVLGTDDDPFTDSRLSLLRRRIGLGVSNRGS
jgi:hypothetical protein